ncbi:hypothetical protein Q5P01_016164 [Channa striata]|uniref:Pseudopodium-enriched atypical kinase 1 n=1 Tax=Channa striata TaxID=64152 RepID=A0AA88MDF7_CHASR|nr:hypothetical protein Q5P01_016164 [Channa striata]
MASGSASREDGQPPALPVKQHRRSLSHSSMESDFTVFTPVGLQNPNYTYNDVFSESTDCHADHCPIHQRYDPCRHQERFFSDGPPPPVPKKRLARTLSLPGTSAPPLFPLSPLSPLQRHPQNFDNPLYMLAPIANTYLSEVSEEIKPARRSTIPLLPFSQLTFDTPDEHLPYLFSSFDEQRVISQGIQHRHLLFLRSMAQSLEADILLQGEAPEKDYSTCQPQDFLFSENREPQKIGDKVYYSLHSPKFPGKGLGLKVHRQTDEAPSPQIKRISSHVNVQDVLVYFQPSRTLSKDSATACKQDPCILFKSECTAAKPPCGGSTEPAKDPTNNSLASLESLLLQGHSVSIERDLPQVSLEDFVQECRSLQSTEQSVYDKQVCVLLLQILTGSQHLYKVSATAAELRPQDILLVWPRRRRNEGRNKLDEGASERKRSFTKSILKDEMELETSEKKGRIQTLWRTHGSARVVLTPKVPAQSAPHSLPFIKSQMRSLIQYCLHPQQNLTGSTETNSSHRRGLLYLSSLLKNESSGPQMADMVAMLQVLLWGPQAPLLNLAASPTTAVHNWLTIKRALLVMKLAERGLIQDQSVLDWEDCMCLQYLSFTDPETVVSVTSQLWLNLDMD